MIDLIKLQFSNLFFPLKTLSSRSIRKYQLIETILFLWPIYIISIFYNYINLYLTNTDTFNLFFNTASLAFDAFFFPFGLCIYSFLLFICMRFIIPQRLSDREIWSIVGQSLTAGLFMLVPILGPGANWLISKVILFVCLNKQLGKSTTFLAILFPYILSIFFIIFLFFMFGVILFVSSIQLNL